VRAQSLLRERKELDQGGFVDLVLWELPSPTADRPHGYKYRLAYVRGKRCVLRYDNETGKGDHRHYGRQQQGYTFDNMSQLIEDFIADVERLGGTHD
jgi:hypothetical protein